jgi:hypothetical protein
MGKLQFREVVIDGDHNTIPTKSFKPPVERGDVEDPVRDEGFS